MNELNELSVRVYTRSVEDRKRQLLIAIAVDGELLGPGLPVDLKELYRTLKYSAEMWIFAPPNGIPSTPLTLKFFAVHRLDDEIRWEWHCPKSREAQLDDGDGDGDGDNVKLRKATFNIAQYDETLMRTWWRVCSALRSDPNLELTSTDFDRAVWLSLDKWLHSAEAEPWGGKFLTKTFS